MPLLISSPSYTATASSSIERVRIGVRAKVQSGVTETVALDSFGSGRTTGSGTITSDGSIPGGAAKKVVVFISRNASNTINSVTAGGVSLAQLAAKVTIGGRDHECWWGYGTFASSGVSVVMSTSTNGHLAWFQFDKSDSSAPLISTGATGTGTAVTSNSVSGTNKGFVIASISHESGDSASNLAGAGYTKRTDESNGNGSNINSLFTETKPITSTGTEAGSATLNSSSTWSALTVTVAPAASLNPITTMNLQSPSGTAGPTNQDLTWSSTAYATQYADFTGDRAWTESLINGSRMSLTRKSVSSANLLVDHMFYEVVDSTGNIIRISCEQMAASDS